MAMDKIGITLPAELRQKVDHQAAYWLSDRSSAISRMIQEWFMQNQNIVVKMHTSIEAMPQADAELSLAA